MQLAVYIIVSVLHSHTNIKFLYKYCSKHYSFQEQFNEVLPLTYIGLHV